MVTVTLDELERNAVLAALDDRVRVMGRQLCTLQEQRDSPDNRFAIETTRDAIRYAMRATLKVVESDEESEYPSDMTLARLDSADWAPGEYTAGWGK